MDATNRVTGESPETARLIAGRMGIQHIEWIQASFSNLIPELLQKRFDVIAAGLFITDERRKQVLFSNPTVQVFPGLLIRKGNPSNFLSPADLRTRKDLRLAVLTGSVEEKEMAQLGPTAGTIVPVPDAQTGYSAVSLAAVDGLLLSLPTVRLMAAQSDGKLEAKVDPVLTSDGSSPCSHDCVGFAFRPDEQALQNAWNRAQESVIGTPAHLAAIAPFHFGAEDVAVQKDAERARGAGQ